MIIDTSILSDDELSMIGYLLSEGLRPNDKGEWNFYDEKCELNSDRIFVNKKMIIKLDNIVGQFILFKEHNFEVESLIGMPNKCKKFDISGLKIKNLDYIPIAEEYDFENCEIEKITYKFPSKILSLNMLGNRIKSLKNLPSQASILLLSRILIKDLKNIPFVDDELCIEHCHKLKDVSEIRGAFKTLWLKDIPKLKSLPSLSASCTRLIISDCPNLEHMEGVLSLNKGTKIEIHMCPKIDHYMLLQSKADLSIHNETKKSNMSDLVTSAISKRNLSEIRNMSRLDFEKILFEEMINGPRIYENIVFKTNEVNEMLKNYISSNKTINKFNL